MAFKDLPSKGAAIAQWICLRLPSSHPEFESQALVFVLCLPCEENENKQKEAGFGPFFKKRSSNFFPQRRFVGIRPKIGIRTGKGRQKMRQNRDESKESGIRFLPEKNKNIV